MRVDLRVPVPVEDPCRALGLGSHWPRVQSLPSLSPVYLL